MPKHLSKQPRHKSSAPKPKHLGSTGPLQKAGAALTAFALSGIGGLFFLQPASAAPCVVSQTISASQTLVRIESGTNCDWSVPAGVTSIAVAVVGGGGGGGNAFSNMLGGGGGAGEVLLNDNLSVTPAESISISIGNGGSGSVADSDTFPLSRSQAENGEPTTFGTVTALGGGAGGSYNPDTTTAHNATSGGSGGGQITGSSVATAGVQGSFLGWTSYSANGGLWSTTPVPGGSIAKGGVGGGAKGSASEPRTGIYLFGECLAVGGTGAVRGASIYGSPMAFDPSEHYSAVGCLDADNNQVPGTAGSIINIEPEANSGSGGAFYFGNNDNFGMSGATGVVLIKFTSPIQDFTTTQNPVIVGGTDVGDLLTASTPGWSPTPDFSYQWIRGGVPISGAINNTYQISASDLGRQITLETTATLAGYNTQTRTSSAISIPNPPPPARPNPAQNPDPVITPTPTVSESPAPVSTPSPTNTPEATAVPIPIATPSPAPTPTPTISETAIVTPVVPDVETTAAGEEPLVGISPFESILAAAPVEAITAFLTDVFAPIELTVGAPIENIAIGATGDDTSPPEEFDPLGSQETIVALTDVASKAVAIVATVAGAAAAAGAAASAASAASGAAAGAASSASSATAANPNSSASSGSSSNSNSGSSSRSTVAEYEGEREDEVTELKVSVDQIGLTQKGLGDALGIFALPLIKFFDRPSNRWAVRVAKFSPLLSKVLTDGSYLRAMFGSLSLIPVFVAGLLGFVAGTESPGQILTPSWLFLLAIAVLGVFDVMAGFAASATYWITALVLLGSVPTFDDIRSLMAISVIAMGPALLTTAFRKLRRQPAQTTQQWWERLSDLAIAPFMAGWSVSIMISVLPAVTGFTSAAANHATDYGIAVALAAGTRVALEEIVAHLFPKRLDRINPSSVPEPPMSQRAVGLAIKYSIWVLISNALIGPGWQAWVGSAIFLLPTIVRWFDDNFPNSPTIWRLMPSGVPGLAFSMLVTAATTSLVANFTGANPELAQWNFVLLPLPLLIVSTLGLFGRHGATERDRKLSQRNVWVYRLGGIVVFAFTLQLVGII